MFASNNLTLLYIDGNIDARELNTTFIRNNGFNVFTANNTSRGYDLYQAHTIDLILIDIPLPDENGIEFIRHLRQLDITVPVIITTDITDKKILLDAINLDISRYLIKPFDRTELLDAINSVVKKIVSSFHNTTSIKLDHNFSYDKVNKSVIRPDGTIVHLSKNEYLLLELLLEHKRKIVSYEAIESVVWPTTSMNLDALRTMVRAIRKKTYPDIISNHNSIGYKIDV